MKNHIIIGLTGGIGSGKSTVSELFQKHGIPVFNADVISRSALEPGTDCYHAAVTLFGKECLNSDTSINRKYVAERVFSDSNLREQLNGIIHPYVKKKLQSETEKLPNGLVIWEVPLLFESKTDSECDITIAVTCREQIRIRRIINRDHMSKEQAKARINAQMTDKERKARADYVIRNEGSIEQLEGEVLSLIEKLEAKDE